MKIIFKTLSTILMVCFIFSMNNCTYKNAEDIYPASGGCNTANMSYTNDIQPIMSTYCYSCHGSTPIGMNNKCSLITYADVAAQVDPASGDILYGEIVLPDVQSISHMPYLLPSLSSCQIAKIKAWIDQGYKNN